MELILHGMPQSLICTAATHSTSPSVKIDRALEDRYHIVVPVPVPRKAPSKKKKHSVCLCEPGQFSHEEKGRSQDKDLSSTTGWKWAGDGKKRPCLGFWFGDLFCVAFIQMKM